jgi:hypothetical protein
MSAKKSLTIKTAALAATIAIGAAVAPGQAQVVPTPDASAKATVVVDEDGRIAAPIAVGELEPSDDDGVIWHNYINCQC